MLIEINPRSFLNLEHICEVLYKLHPLVLNRLVEMERSLGPILGFIDTDNLSLEEREFLSRNYTSEPMEEEEEVLDINNYKEKEDEKYKLDEEDGEEKYNRYIFDRLRRYIQLDTDEYIPMKISIEVEDPVIGRKVRELVRALEKTRAPEQFYLGKKEMDEDAYFAEGYGLTMNEEQKKKFDDFFGVLMLKVLKKF